MKCKSCEFDNISSANYCENCGNKLNSSNFKKSNQLPENKHQKENTNIFTSLISIKFVWILFSLVLASLLILSIIESDSPRSSDLTNNFTDKISDNPFIEAKVFEVASNFVCGCGSCNEESLDICKCGYAVNERDFIRKYLEKSPYEMTVINAVINKYGRLKSGVSLDRYRKSEVIQSSTNEETGILNKKASLSDRVFIYSQFRCPCGKCGMDELKDCSCDHPKGAKEVKNFIDSKIMQGNLMVIDIINEVDNVYGGKKI